MPKSDHALDKVRQYARSGLGADATAACIVAVMLVPQAMAYAMLAGLPPVIGLYASTFPLLAYALIGTSRQLAIGPVAMLSILVAGSCSRFASPGSPEYLSVVAILTLEVGILQLLLGVVRMGFLVNFVSHAVIGGFTSAAAIVIGMSQLKHIVGIPLPDEHTVVPLLLAVPKGISEVNLYTAAIGLVSIAVLVVFKLRKVRFPGPLLIVFGSTLLLYLLRHSDLGIETVGHVPRGLPDFVLPSIQFQTVKDLLPIALTVLFVGYMESIAVAEWVSAKARYPVDANRELGGLGLANIVASVFSGYPVTGGLSRTAVNYQAGVRTRLAGVFTAVLVIIALMILTPLFYYLPKCVLSAIIIVAVAGLVDLKEPRHLFNVKKTDGWIYVFTFVATLFVGLEQGILGGIALSLIVFVWRSAHPHAAELGYLESEDVFRNVKRFPEARTFPEALILRVDASLYFANMGFVERLVRSRIEERVSVKWVVFDLTGVNDMDAVAVSRFERLIEDYRERGVTFLFAAMKGPVRDIIARAAWAEKYGSSVDYVSVQTALEGTGLLERSRARSS